MTYGLATPPTSPIRPKNGKKLWPSTLKNNNISEFITEYGIITKEENAHDISILTPPASPTKEINSPKERQIRLSYQKDVPDNDDESSDTDEDTQLLHLDHSIEQLDGIDIRGEQTSKGESFYLSERESSHDISSTNPRESLHLCSDIDIVAQERESCSAQIFSSKTQRNRPLTPLPLRRRPMLSTTVQSRQCLANLQRLYTSPDRFVAQRSPPDNDIVTSFKIGKSTDKLCNAERITRSQNAGPNPFSTHIPHIVPLSRTRVGVPTSNLRYERRVSQYSVGMLGLHQFNDAPQRQVSGGTVWCVGGPGAVTDSSIGVSDGRGGLLRSGTNAPLYGNLFTSRADAASILNAHERRIALAANLDQSRRVLAVNDSFGDNAQIVAHSQLPVAGKIIWRDNEWTAEGNTKSMFSSC